MHSFILERVASAIFDDPNLVSCAGLVPMIALAQQCDLPALADVHLSVPTDKGANAGAKVTSLVAGMVAGADSIEDMALLRHGAMGTLFDRPYAPSTLGSFLREFTFRRSPTRRRRHPAGDPTARPHLAARRDRRPGTRRHRRHHHRSARTRQGGVWLRILRGPRIERADHHRHHGAGCTGDRWAAAAQRRVRVRARSCPDGGRPWPPCADCGPPNRRDWCCCEGTPRFTDTSPCPRRCAAGLRCRSPCTWTRRSPPPSPPSVTMTGRPSNTPTRSTTRPPADGSPVPRSPGVGVHRIQLQEGQPAGSRPVSGASHPRPQPPRR